MKPSPATALVAYAQALSMQEPVDDSDIVQLIEAVCGSRSERAALLVSLRSMNDSDTKPIVSDLLRSYASDQVEKSEGFGGKDTAAGIWTQAFGGTLFLFSLAGTVAGTISGVAAVLAIGAPVVVVAGASCARLHLMGRKSRHKKLAEQAESLVKSIGEIK